VREKYFKVRKDRLEKLYDVGMATSGLCGMQVYLWLAVTHTHKVYLKTRFRKEF
jgi:hypothetical protein